MNIITRYEIGRELVLEVYSSGEAFIKDDAGTEICLGYLNDEEPRKEVGQLIGALDSALRRATENMEVAA